MQRLEILTDVARSDTVHSMFSSCTFVSVHSECAHDFCITGQKKHIESEKG